MLLEKNFSLQLSQTIFANSLLFKPRIRQEKARLFLFLYYTCSTGVFLC